MTPAEALQILDAATQPIALPRKEHQLIVEALTVLQNLIKSLEQPANKPGH